MRQGRLALVTLALLLAIPAAAFASLGWQPTQLMVPAPGTGDEGPDGQLSIATAADGTATAAWVRSFNTNTGRHYAVDVSVRPPDGDWGPVEQIGSSRSDGGVALAVAPDGAAAAVWGDEQDGTIHLAMRPAGGSFGPPQALTPGGSGARQAAQVAIDSAGDVVVGWRNRLPSPGMEDQIDATVVSPSGAASPVQVLDDLVAGGGPYSGEALELSSVVPDGSGNVYLEWRHSFTDIQHPANSYDRIEIATLGSGQSSFGAPTSIATAMGGVTLQEPGLAGNAAGDLLITWKRAPASGKATVEGRYRHGGEPLSGKLFEVPQPDGLDADRPVPAIAPDGSGGFVWGAGPHAAYADTIWAAKVSSTGALGTPVALGGGVTPELAAGPSGELIASWGGPPINLYFNRVYASVSPPGHGFSDATPLSDVLASPSSPRVAIQPSGDAVAIWIGPPDYSHARYQWSAEYEAGEPHAGGSALDPVTPAAATPVPSRADPVRSGGEVTSFSVSRHRFATAGRHRGTSFRYSLAEPGRVRIVISRSRDHRRLGTIERDASVRAGVIRFSGRLRSRPLPAGLYRATISAGAGAGPSVSFRVLG